jgi:hypothetical protein
MLSWRSDRTVVIDEDIVQTELRGATKRHPEYFALGKVAYSTLLYPDCVALLEIQIDCNIASARSYLALNAIEMGQNCSEI